MMQTITAAEFRALGQKRGKAHGVSKKPGELNRTETAYWQHLDFLKRHDHIQDFWTQEITLKLGNDLRLTVDFFVFTNDGELHAIDTKGTKKLRRKSGRVDAVPYVEPDAQIKLTVAAGKFPFRFFKAWIVDGAWRQEEVKA